jgi:curved DNA-binding protein CbpA
MTGGGPFLIVTLVLLGLIATGVYVSSTALAWRSLQADVEKASKRGRLFTSGFTCCSVLALIFALLSLLSVAQLNSDVGLFNYDPWKDLGLPKGTFDVSEVKAVYRKLSKTHHPDRGGDAKTFQRIARAYSALTDPAAKANFLEKGNPEGTLINYGELPGWLSFGGEGVSAEDANKRAAMATIGLVLAFLISVPVAGLWFIRNRGRLVRREDPNYESPVEMLLKKTAGGRNTFRRNLERGHVDGEIGDEEFREFMAALKEADIQAAAEALKAPAPKGTTPKKAN